MSQGSIVDFKIRVKPSTSLIEFITSLDDVPLMPENVISLFKAYNPNKLENVKIKLLQGTTKTEKLTKSQNEILKNIELNEEDFVNFNDILNSKVHESEDGEGKSEKNLDNKKKTEDKLDGKLLLELSDLRWLDKVLVEKRNKGEYNVYLHELLQDSELILPENEIIPRNPELEARCRKLKDEQEAKEYRDMTKNVDSVRRTLPEDTVSYQIKAINRQLIAVLQFIFSVAAGFAFGFLGVELIIGNLDFGFRLLLGIICSLTIALAEIYFLAKKLNEYDDMEVESYSPQPSSKKEHLD